MFVGMLVAMFLAAVCIAVAQNPAEAAPAAQMSVPNGYAVHESVDVGGRLSNQVGSGAMYGTLVNLQSGPRVLGETFELHALPGTKNAPLDDLRAFASGFGGDPDNVAKLDFSKSKLYEFSGLFRRDRRYFDYDLLGNPNIPSGQSIAVSPSGALAWPQDTSSPFLFNTVRRMTDTNLTLLPLAKVTFRVGYSQNVMQGPSITPSGYQLAGSYSLLLQEYQRNSSDDFLGAVDWKPVQNTKIIYEERVTHYKANSYFNLAPSNFIVQEADGTMAAPLITYDSLTPYKSTACDATSMGGGAMLTASPTGGAPIINAACAVATSYFRSQPTRILYPTETLRLQSSSIKNVAMNGDIRYTDVNMSLPAYYDSFQGLTTANVAKGTPAYRSYVYTGAASAKREVMALDYGVTWAATKTVSVEEQISYSNVRQPGSTTMTSETTVADPVGAGNGTINNSNLTTANAAAGASTFEGSGNIGTPLPAYFGQRFTTNNLTVSWDATPRSTFSFTYRYQDHLISEGQGTGAHNVPIPANNTTSGEVTIHENGGIFDAALRPANNWDINGSVEAMYNDNAFTPMGFRQLRHYRVHTIYRPKSWATVSGAFNDLERHNNTNNNQSIDGEHHTLRRTARSCGPFAGGELRRGAVPERSLWAGLQLFVQRRVHVRQHLLSGERQRGVARRGDSRGHGLSQQRRHAGRHLRLRTGQGLHGRSDAVCLVCVYVLARQAGALQSRLSRQLGERNPVLQRSPGCGWLAGVHVSISLPELLVGVAARLDLEGRVQFLWLRRRRSVGCAVLQHHQPHPHGSGHAGSLQFALERSRDGRADRNDDLIRGRNGSAEFPRQQRGVGCALSVLKKAVKRGS